MNTNCGANSVVSGYIKIMYHCFVIRKVFVTANSMRYTSSKGNGVECRLWLAANFSLSYVSCLPYFLDLRKDRNEVVGRTVYITQSCSMRLLNK
jgi:hypothetical protein